MNDPYVFIVDIDMVTRLKKVRHYVISKRSINYATIFSIETRDKSFGCVFLEVRTTGQETAKIKYADLPPLH